MKQLNKRILSLLMVVASLFALTMVAFAADEGDTSVITSDSEYYLTADEVLNGGYFSEEEIASATENGAIILCGIDAPVAELAESTKARIITGQAWCRSYATYDTDKGVQIHIELYVPWYYFTNPKFTDMSGTVSVKLNSKTTTATFVKHQSEGKTISMDISTGAKASSGTKGTVNISGVAAGTNVATGAGAFTSSYEITIP